MKFTHTHLTLAAAFWLALGSTLASSGQNVAQAPWRGVQQEPASRSGGPLQPITAEHRGRLLVLTCGPKPGAGGSASFTGPRGEPPRFAVYQGHRQIASGQFEYG